MDEDDKTKPKIVTATETIYHGDNLNLKLEGEDYRQGDGPLDTRVTIEGGTLCWITWSERDQFLQEFKTLIDKYAI